ncbi:MAG: hypothetical protein EOO78_21955, partial [Oxalobacteraceae bacterium]
LGIDTVKQAEVLSILRQRFGVPAQQRLDLAGLHTIASIADALFDHQQADPEQANILPGDSAQAPDLVPAPDVAPPPPGAAAPPERAAVLAELVGLFAAATGYNPEEIAIDHALEADLGIDTVKQAEILAQVRQRYGLAQLSAPKLAELQTVAAIADYVVQHRGAAAAPAAPSPPAATPAPALAPAAPPPLAASASSASSASSEDEAGLQTQIVALISEHTGYGVDELAADHGLEADLGIDTVKQAEIMAIVRGKYGLPTDPNFALSQVGTIAQIAAYIALQRRQHGTAQATPAAAGPAAPDPAAPQDQAAHDDAQALLHTAQQQGFVCRPRRFVVLPAVPFDSAAWQSRRVLCVGSAGPLVAAVQQALTQAQAQPTALPLPQGGNEVALPGELPPQDLLVVLGAVPPEPEAALQAVETIFSLLQAFGRGRASVDARLIFAGPGKALQEKGGLSLVLAALYGMGRSVAREWPQVQVAVVDTGELPAQRAAEAVLAWGAHVGSRHVVHQAGDWHTPQLDAPLQ